MPGKGQCGCGIFVRSWTEYGTNWDEKAKDMMPFRVATGPGEFGPDPYYSDRKTVSPNDMVMRVRHLN